MGSFNTSPTEGTVSRVAGKRYVYSGGAWQPTTAIVARAITTGVLDLDLANHFNFTPTANTTLSVVNKLPAIHGGDEFYLTINNGGAYNITYFAGVEWESKKVPELSNKRDMLGFSWNAVSGKWVGTMISKAAESL